MTRSGRRLLGYGYTNAGGVATMDYDANNRPIPEHGYVGVGAGKINMRVECRSVSVPCNVLDCILIDENTNHYSKWGNRSNRLTITADGTGVLLENSSGNRGYYGLGEPSRATIENYMFDWQTPICFEFDILNYSQADQVYVQISDQNNHNFIKTLSDLSITTTSHIKIEVTDKIYVTVDNSTPLEFANAFDGKFLFTFALNTGYSFKFENFKVYPI